MYNHARQACQHRMGRTKRIFARRNWVSLTCFSVETRRRWIMFSKKRTRQTWVLFSGNGLNHFSALCEICVMSRASTAPCERDFSIILDGLVTILISKRIYKSNCGTLNTESVTCGKTRSWVMLKVDFSFSRVQFFTSSEKSMFQGIVFSWKGSLSRHVDDIKCILSLCSQLSLLPLACVILGFHRGWNEFVRILGYYASLVTILNEVHVLR
jgi:hypothetical protein